MDFDTRLLRSFAVVAEEANLTRAAERLFVSQPALTKQIRHLEGQLGVRLFSRSRTGMALTAAGRALADRVPAVLATIDQALRETRSAASSAARVLRVGFLAGAANEATQHIIAAFARRRPDWQLEMRAAAWTDPSAGLAAGTPTSPCCGYPSPARTACAPRCCSPSLAGWRCPPRTRWPGATRSASGICGTSPSSPPPPQPAGGATGGWPPASGRVIPSGSGPSPTAASPTTG
jgi:hypothetical protein